jgi:hypothetical protein
MNGKREEKENESDSLILTLSILPPTYSPALIYFGRERGWWITCNYPRVLKEKNINKQKEYNLRYHNVGPRPTL